MSQLHEDAHVTFNAHAHNNVTSTRVGGGGWRVAGSGWRVSLLGHRINQIDCLISYSNQLLKTTDLDARSKGIITKISEDIKLAVLFMYKIDDVNGFISGSLFKDEADKLKDRGADHDLIGFKASLVFIDEQLRESSELYMDFEEKSLETERECILVETSC